MTKTKKVHKYKVRKLTRLADLTVSTDKSLKPVYKRDPIKVHAWLVERNHTIKQHLYELGKLAFDDVSKDK